MGSFALGYAMHAARGPWDIEKTLRHRGTRGEELIRTYEKDGGRWAKVAFIVSERIRASTQKKPSGLSPCQFPFFESLPTRRL